MAQKSTYQGLTKKESRLLEVLLEPGCRFMTVTEICGLVPCDRKTYYKAFAKPEFVEEYTRRAADLAKKHLGQVMNTFVEEAVKGSFQHGKVLLEMAGVYTEKQEQRHSGQVGFVVEVDYGDDEPK